MGMKRSFQHIVPLMMAAAMIGEELKPERAAEMTPKEVDELRGKRRKFLDEKANKNRIQNFELKEYVFGEIVIYARNQKNADRKAKNAGLI